MKYFTKRNFTVLTKYINNFFIIVLITFLVLRLHLDLTTDDYYRVRERYSLLLLLILIFWFDNLFTRILRLIIGIYALQELYFVSLYAAMPTPMEFSTKLFWVHIKSRELKVYLMLYFPYLFYISMIFYSGMKIIFKLYEPTKSLKNKREDLDDILDA